jgi:16S rRNA (uracil1498-N3)-methyltransferase
VPVIHDVMGLAAWAKARALSQATGHTPTSQSLLLSLRPGTQGLRAAVSSSGNAGGDITFLSGPEGGLSAAEEDLALACGFAPVTLGPRVLRAETAALTALAALLV